MNIYSKSKDLLGRHLTNVSSLPLMDKDGREYVSAEHMYQSWKTGSFCHLGFRKCGGKVKGDIKLIIANSERVMRKVLACKLRAYPELLMQIDDLGGSRFLSRCTHYVNGRDKHWECVDGQGAFMRALTEAYERVTNE